MRFWFRLSPRTGVTMPWYLAFFVYMLWGTLWLLGLMLLIVLAVVLLAAHGAMIGWERWKARRA